MNKDLILSKIKANEKSFIEEKRLAANDITFLLETNSKINKEDLKSYIYKRIGFLEKNARELKIDNVDNLILQSYETSINAYIEILKIID